MTALTIPTRHARPADWYAVSVPPLAPPPPRDTFTIVSTALAAPVTERSRGRTDAVLADLARAARADHLVPRATDPDAAVHRLAARILSHFVHDPDQGPWSRPRPAWVATEDDTRASPRPPGTLTSAPARALAGREARTVRRHDAPSHGAPP